jgi:HK97 family phage prohead protease
MIERAILQEVIAGRGGQTRHYQRPKEVRQIAKRLHGWARQPEGCIGCRREASTIRSGQALCAVCLENEDARAVVLPARGLPFKERAADELSGQGIAGTFIVFDSESVDLGGFTEIVKPQAVDRSLKADDIRALWAHDTAQVLGRRSAGTIDVEKQRQGLFARISPPAWAADYLETVGRGDITQASFGFMVIEDVWHFMREEEKILREILDMVIFEVSVVAFPAYPATRVRVEKLSDRRERETLTRLQMAR